MLTGLALCPDISNVQLPLSRMDASFEAFVWEGGVQAKGVVTICRSVVRGRVVGRPANPIQ